MSLHQHNIIGGGDNGQSDCCMLLHQHIGGEVTVVRLLHVCVMTSASQCKSYSQYFV